MTAARSIAPARQPVRVLLIDDSAVVRGMTRRWLSDQSAIEIVGMSSDGGIGVSDAERLQPDVILLDIEMPNMDGLQALPKLRQVSPQSKIIMASTLTRRGAEVTIKALSLGATDYLPKPEAGQLGGADAYKRDLVGKILGLGRPQPVPSGVLPRSTARAPVQRPAPEPRPRARSVGQPSALFVASSTGGPQALQAFLPTVANRLNVPIFVVQHMPPTFTTILAEHINEMTKGVCKEGEDGEPVVPGTIYIAPGGYHMTVKGRLGTGVKIALDQSPQVNYCRPAADPLFGSGADVYGNQAFGVVLTGMGSDGKNGSEQIVKAGGRIFAQDRGSSVVWGMPGAVTNAGLAEEVKPLSDLGAAVVKVFSGAGR